MGDQEKGGKRIPEMKEYFAEDAGYEKWKKDAFPSFSMFRQLL